MVFGWGKKKKESKVIPEAPMSSTEREVSFSDIDKILDDLKKIRSKTLISETSSFKKRIENQLKEVREIGIDLEKDDLKIDDIDKHLKTIVERGKKQVISTIKEETSHKISDVKSIDDVMSMSTQVNRSLKKIGDVLGRQSRVIHLFAKKYAGRLKTILAELQDDLETVQTLIGNYKKLEDGILEIDQNVRNINRAKESLTKKSKRVKTFEESIKEFEEKKNQINSEIEELKNSEQYNEFLQVKKQLEQLEPEKHDLRQEINDQFTKISRPLGKYEYVSSMDKDQKNLLNVLVSDPFSALSHDKKNDIITILQSVKKGVLAGSVSVKDTEKSIQFLDEITEMLDSLIKQKEAFSEKENVLKKKLDNFDMNKLKQKQSELDKINFNYDDAQSKIEQYQNEISDAKKLIPKLTMDIEQKLRDISATKYTIKTENS